MTQASSPTGEPFVEVVVTLPVQGRFHYSVPPHLRGALEIGHRVLVPFGRRRVTAFVVASSEAVPTEVGAKIRAVLERLDVEPLLPREVLEVATFAADYYLATPGEVLKLAVPPGLTGATVSRYVTTDAGRRALESQGDRIFEEVHLDASKRAALERANRGGGVRTSALDRGVARWLESRELITRTARLDARERRGEERRFALAVSREEATSATLRAPAKRRIVECLANAEGLGIATLERSVGKRGLASMLRKMVIDGLVVETRSAAISAPHDVATHTIDAVPTSEHTLTVEQSVALASILGALEKGGEATFLLNGVTGSGKTEVYLGAIAEARRRGKGAIVLVPEIALTPQLEERFRARFGDDVVVLHSQIRDAERRKRWRSLREGRAHIALGARSAIWAPVRDLGIVVVDEEHDGSFKQGSDVRYNGRDLALVRAHQSRCVAVLGSATPSLETLHLVSLGRMRELRLSERVRGRAMPTVDVIDLVEERRASGGLESPLSRTLLDRLREVVRDERQAILFLNRRGFNTIVYCDECGDARKCPRCDVSLTHHRARKSLVCHHCDHDESFESACRKCGSFAMQPFGAGTERVARAVEEDVPGARVLRLDRDVVAKAGALDATLGKFRRGEANVLVGTQMVAKGHDFPRVTLVGVISADASLAFPDFRASERTFQLLTQVAGRAGRADDPGHVVIQTFQPHHYVLECAIRHDVERFAMLERDVRSRLGYPPFSRVGLVRVESEDAAEAERVARCASQIAERQSRGQDIRVRGPVPAPIARIRDRYRHMLMLRAPTPRRLAATMRAIASELGPPPARVDVIYDVDAFDLL